MTQTVDNSQDIMDSRDVIARIEELQSEICDAFEADDEIPEWDDLAPKKFGIGVEDDDDRAFLARCEAVDMTVEAEELAQLLAFQDEGEGAADWMHGETLIRESHFTEYAQDLAEDIAPSHEAREMGNQWPYNHIDWDAAADALKMDYFTATLDGVDYYIRS